MIYGISRKKEIDSVFSQGKVRRFSFGRAYILEKDPEHDSSAQGVRLVVIIRRKLGKAVKRNRARRILKEALRALLKSEKLKKPVDMAIVLNTADISFNQVLEEMRVGLKSYFERE